MMALSADDQLKYACLYNALLEVPRLLMRAFEQC